jgi:ribosomal-protein-alanine N-acetyltransferase
VLRASTPDDVDPLYEIQGDRDAMAHTYCAPDRNATAAWLEAYAARRTLDGFSPWTAVLQSEGTVVGWGGLNVDPKDPRFGVEVAYFIHKAHWGHGLASEIVAAALSWAFGELALPSVAAFAREENAASVRVLEKSGFQFTRFVPELNRNQYTALREDRAA